ncbi:MAG: anthranilate synthase component I [Bacteroidetes bacterium RBG_19FT_COMBO_42_7]|nr:MAG: anthranilate synthase component I [Bacteroidetes bacterium RBG_19FT_COMBO_42_7]
MKKFKIHVNVTEMFADLITPVSIYLRIRDVYPNSLLLESSDYHGNENSFSFICLKPVATFKTDNGIITEAYPDGDVIETELTDHHLFNTRFTEFIRSFGLTDIPKEIPVNGLFGYTSYDMLEYFEKVKLKAAETPDLKIPDTYYGFYNYIIAINHFQNKLYIIENQIDAQPGETERIKALLNSRNIALYSFQPEGPETSNLTDDDYKSMVTKGKEHCHRGDVFQVVLSRQFARKYRGDDFNVYRALRSINPSPYLFYFDYGNFKLFGSSPEAHLRIRNDRAYINPIAGTFKRTGDDEKDKILAEELSADIKENSEHIMLVDLARNDLSKHAGDVKVESYREVQFYSHVIHLVSSVSGEMMKSSSIIDMMTATFPAGTLTGAPKYRAIQLIDKYENRKRGYYGGAIGFIDFRNRFNHAIMIRTFLSKGNILYYQAGAGIVAISNEESELQEVNNKIGALKKAIEMAEKIN